MKPKESLAGCFTLRSRVGSQCFFEAFDQNVTNPLTGGLYAFQAFSDIRFRLAFADSVNMTSINADVNNKLGQVATSVVAYGLAPNGSYNSSIIPRCSFNPDAAAQLLFCAMQSRLSQFIFYGGTVAPAGYFNNSFGCNPLPASGSCSKPIPTPPINLYVDTGNGFDIVIFTQIAEVVNNISSTCNMGLQVSVVPIPAGTLFTGLLESQIHITCGQLDGVPIMTGSLTLPEESMLLTSRTRALTSGI